MPSPPPPPRPRNTDRLFLALLPDAPALRQITQMGAALREELGLAGSLAPPERLHVTLHFLGDHPGLPHALVESVSRLAAAAAAGASSFPIRFDHVGSFPRRQGRRPFVLRGVEGMAAVIGFQRRLGEAMASAALGHTPNDQYTPHLTLLYDAREVAIRPIIPTVGWTACDFVLVRSRIGRASHEVLARWSLQPPT